MLTMEGLCRKGGCQKGLGTLRVVERAGDSYWRLSFQEALAIGCRAGLAW